MIEFMPIKATVMRYFYILKNDINYMLFTFYWPSLDIIMGGFLGSWIEQFQSAQFNDYKIIILLGLLTWQISSRGSNVIIGAFNEEIWSNNLITLFSLPIKISQWIIGVILFYLLMTIISSIFCIFLIYIFYDLSIYRLVSTFLIFAVPSIFSGIWLGFAGLQILVMLGKRSTELAYVIAWFLMPFSGVTYPIEALPSWAQNFSKFIPMSYTLQAMRQYINNQDFIYLWIKGLVLSIIYAIFSVLLFGYFFKLSKRKGLARLLD